MKNSENNSDRFWQNDNLVLLSPPCPKVDFDKKEYPWHLEIRVACKLNFSDRDNLMEEFKLQTEIEKEFLNYFSVFANVKDVISLHHNNMNIYHWYLSSQKIELSVSDILKFDKINLKRAISFEMDHDKNWTNVIPLLDQIKYKVPGLHTLVDRLKENNPVDVPHKNFAFPKKWQFGQN